MKRILYTTTAVLVSAGLLLASCKDNSRLATESIPVAPATVSASEYAEFKEWKQQQLENTSRTTTTATRPVIVRKYYTVNKVTPAVQPVAKKKKGWSKAAKGTAIGAGAGAAAGALLVKNNRALGAVIGGVVGGGVGYGVGRSMDKKDGRY
ncbi:glycine zipper domain-containing protein [Niastella vici]|uniref:glycine zipper domain-containing protein n=1 Tax=Niastella vici TaxID=1703345 RepID=UPI0009C16694|nr:glycine zipper domain-containing protein [Niastella vici]